MNQQDIDRLVSERTTTTNPTLLQRIGALAILAYQSQQSIYSSERDHNMGKVGPGALQDSRQQFQTVEQVLHASITDALNPANQTSGVGANAAAGQLRTEESKDKETTSTR